MTLIAHSWYMTLRHLRSFARQPWLIMVSLFQPLLWLLFFGTLFQRVVEIPGFTATSYLDFFTPTVVLMSALFQGLWAGMTIIEDYDRGVLDRFLVSPVSRGAMILGRIAYQAVVTIVQAMIIVGVGTIIGARFNGGVTSIVALVVCAVLVGAAFGSLSNAFALQTRRAETLVATTQFVGMPLTFLSSGFMQRDLLPGWVGLVASVNPVNWAIEAARATQEATVAWSVALTNVGYLIAFALVCAWISVYAFRAFQRAS